MTSLHTNDSGPCACFTTGGLRLCVGPRELGLITTPCVPYIVSLLGSLG